MEREFHESTNSIRTELKKFTEAGLLISEIKGKIRYYTANRNHPLYNDIRNIVFKTVGIDQILKNSASVIDNLEALFIIGNFAIGVESETIELAFVGHDLDGHCINKQIQLVEKIIHRKIMYVLYTPSQMDYFFHNKPHLNIWKAGQ